MKHLLTAFFSLIVFLNSFGQNNCEGYFALKEGMKMEITSFDKKDKVTSSVQMEVLEQDVDSDGSISVILSGTLFDKKGEEISRGEYSGKCTNDEFITSVNGISGEMMPKSADMEVTISGTLLNYPNKMEKGQKLPDADITITSGIKDGLTLLKVNTEFTNRKVLGFETIETPAGKFECVKISYDYKLKMILTKTMSAVEYLAKGVGVVKSEQYDKKGNLASSSLLTKLSY